jgi:hypothetical protein
VDCPKKRSTARKTDDLPVPFPPTIAIWLPTSTVAARMDRKFLIDMRFRSTGAPLLRKKPVWIRLKVSTTKKCAQSFSNGGKRRFSGSLHHFRRATSRTLQ